MHFRAALEPRRLDHPSVAHGLFPIIAEERAPNHGLSVNHVCRCYDMICRRPIAGGSILPHTSTIAVVDDDEAIRGAMESLLESCGYKGMAFASGTEFLEYAHHASFACILSDVKMPKMNGIQMLSALNKEPSRPPIIFMTSFADVRIKAEAMRSGALAFLGKPVDIGELMRCLELAIGTQKAAS